MRLFRYRHTIVELGVNFRFFVIGVFTMQTVRNKAPAGTIKSLYIFILPFVYLVFHRGFPKPTPNGKRKRK